MKYLFLLLSIPLVSLGAQAFDHTHKSWDKLLSSSVIMFPTKSEVDYDKFVKNKKELKAYTESISKVSKSDFKSWSQDQQLAFLINTYNAFTIELIVDNYPVKSIKDSKISWLSPFNKEFFKLFGKKRSLSEVEHKMIRKDYQEPRIHFAIVCASIGCPALQNKAFTADNLESLLAGGEKLFLNDKSRNNYDLKKSSISVSKIFDWFEEDFEKKDKSVKEYLARIWAVPADKKAKFLKSNLKYLPYDWNLNKKK